MVKLDLLLVLVLERLVQNELAIFDMCDWSRNRGDGMCYRVSCFLAWYDFWVGGFYDKSKKILYICLLPCIVLKFERRK